MRTRAMVLSAAAMLACPVIASAAIVMAPLSTWGTNGWLAPGASAYLGTGNNERGLAAGNGHVYLVSHASVSGTTANVRILDGSTGADLGGLNNTGVTGGTFTVNTAAVGADGAIYVNNLTTNSTTTAFTVYKWSTESSAPVVAYTGNGALAGSRLGDSLAAIGSGASTEIAAGYNSSPAVTGNNGFALINPTGGTASTVAVTGAGAGDFSLGLTFSDPTHVFGSRTGGSYRDATTSGTLAASGNLIAANPQSTAEKLMAFAFVCGEPILAVESTGDAHVSLYDVTNPANPVFLTAGDTTTGTLAANANATGELAWVVAPDGNSATLYAMSTNSGIQAFTIVPEPATLTLFAAPALLGLIRRRRA